MKTLAIELSLLRELVIVGINSSEPDEVPITCTHYELGRRNKSGMISTIKSILRFRALIEKLKPRAIIVNCALAELFAVFLPKRIRIVVVEHVNPAWEGRKLLGHLIRSLIARRASKVTAVSDHLHFSHSCRPIDLVIPNAQDVNLIGARTYSNEYYKSMEVRSIAFIGRLVDPQKRPGLALRIAQLAQLPITFYGDGPEKFKLELEAKSLSTNVSFRGFVRSVWSEIPPDCLVIVPSLYEGDGLVATEAILLNRPVAVSDIPEFRRFSLKESAYISEVDMFVVNLKSNPSIESFIPPRELQVRLSSEREPKSLAVKWDALLSSI